jgi:hypothetical protein
LVKEAAMRKVGILLRLFSTLAESSVNISRRDRNRGTRAADAIASGVEVASTGRGGGDRKRIVWTKKG